MQTETPWVYIKPQILQRFSFETFSNCEKHFCLKQSLFFMFLSPLTWAHAQWRHAIALENYGFKAPKLSRLTRRSQLQRRPTRKGKRPKITIDTIKG